MTVELTNPDVLIDVYVSKGSESTPTEFEFDFLMKNMKGPFSLDSVDLAQYLGDASGFTISFYV